MALVLLVQNPFEPHAHESHTVRDGLTVRGWLEAHFPGFVEFDRPTICLRNGRPLLRAEWPRQKITGDDVVSFVAVPGELATIFLVVSVVLALAAVVLSFVLQPARPGTTPAADSVFGLGGQRNQLKLGNPIEVVYGACRIWPSYAARPYTVFKDNAQYIFQLFCIGQGAFDVTDILIEETPASSFVEVETALYAPGEPVTLFPDDVLTSADVVAVELYGPNETSYVAPGAGFIVNPAGTTATRLEADLALPAGCYVANDAGGLSAQTVEGLVEFRSVDGTGAPTSGWTTLGAFSQTLATNTPQRYTLGADVAAGRYEVRAYRTNAKNLDARSGNVLRWEAVRAFLPSTRDYGDVTLLAVKAKATNNLNDNAAARFNVRATRKLRSWDVESRTWNTEAPTRSLVWAFADVFVSAYGGRLADTFIDLDALAALDDVYTARAQYFDGIFDQRTTVWEAARIVARCGRATPILQGSRVTMHRDEAKTVATAVFSPDNILAGSFKRSMRLAATGDADGLLVEYIDPTAWKPETVLCLMPGDTGDAPDTVRLDGCTSRAHAYHEGLYLRARARYQRENVAFSTGLEGQIPSFGDLIFLSHDLPRWGVGGLVVSVTGTTLVLSEPVTFAIGITHKIVLRNKDGSAIGPLTVTAGVNSRQVVLADPLSVDFDFSGISELPQFLFGAADSWGKQLTVVGLSPGEAGTVDVRCVGYESDVFAFDSATVPSLGDIPAPPVIPASPVVTQLSVVGDPNVFSTARVFWAPALGAKLYVVERSENGTEWTPAGTTTLTYVELEVSPLHLWIRVAGINTGTGPWATWDGEVGVAVVPPANPLDVELVAPFTGRAVSVHWSAAPGATRYRVRVYQNGGLTLLRTADVPATQFDYTIDDAIADGVPKRSLRFEVVGVNDVGESGTPSGLDVTNPTPAAVGGLDVAALDHDASFADYRLSWTPSADSDLSAYRVHASFVSGFTPSNDNLIFTGPGTAFDVRLAKSGGGHAAYYWRVAARDVWETNVNFSAQKKLAEVATTGGFSNGFDAGFL